MPVLIPILSLTATALISAALCRLLISVAPKDAPDGGRKRQAAAVPTSGGIAIAGAILIAVAVIIALDAANPTPRNHFTALPVGTVLPYGLLCLCALITGAIDDARPLRARVRLLGLFVASLIAAAFGPVFAAVFLPVAEATFLLPAWFAIGGTALWIFVLMNGVNFMDGSNGLAIGMLAIMFSALSIRLFAVPDYGLALFIFATVIVASLVGFLFWNLKGRLYAGDAGSLFAGALFAALCIFAAQDGNIWFPATLALPILVDVFMTLIWRARAGENLLTPHRHHAYQCLIAAGWSHPKTAIFYWAITLACAVFALLASADGKSTSVWVFVALLTAGCGLWLSHRRVAAPDNP